MIAAVFLDRDGTLNREVGHLADPDRLELLPGVKTALGDLAAHFPLVVVTNQAAIARGLLDEEGLRAIHAKLDQMLAPVEILAYYHCPHHPTIGEPPFRQVCACRKPAPGLLHRAARDHGLNLAASFLVGDKVSDLQAGRSAGTRTILLRTGYGEEEYKSLSALGWSPDYLAADLEAAARWILDQKARNQ